MAKKKNVLLGVPHAHAEGITPQLAQTVINLRKMAPKFNWNLKEMTVQGHFIDFSRSMIAAAVEESHQEIPAEFSGLPYDRCLMLDRDMEASPQQIRSIVETDHLVYSASYLARGTDQRSVAAKKFSNDEGYVDNRDFYPITETGEKDVAATGMGCISFSPDVFEMIWEDFPWFPSLNPTYTKAGQKYYSRSGEDMGFCFYTARKYDIPIRVNFDIQVGHYPDEKRRAGDPVPEQLQQAGTIKEINNLMGTCLKQIKTNLQMLDSSLLQYQPKQQQGNNGGNR